MQPSILSRDDLIRLAWSPAGPGQSPAILGSEPAVPAGNAQSAERGGRPTTGFTADRNNTGRGPHRGRARAETSRTMRPSTGVSVPLRDNTLLTDRGRNVMEGMSYGLNNQVDANGRPLASFSAGLAGSIQGSAAIRRDAAAAEQAAEDRQYDRSRQERLDDENSRRLEFQNLYTAAQIEDLYREAQTAVEEGGLEVSELNQIERDMTTLRGDLLESLGLGATDDDRAAVDAFVEQEFARRIADAMQVADTGRLDEPAARGGDAAAAPENVGTEPSAAMPDLPEGVTGNGQTPQSALRGNITPEFARTLPPNTYFVGPDGVLRRTKG